MCDANNQHNTPHHFLNWSLKINEINWQNHYFVYHVLKLTFTRNRSGRWSLRCSTAAEFWNMMLTELSLKWCWKIFNLVRCLQAAEALRQNLLNKESLVLHKGLEMWAMDSASLYSGESIITKDVFWSERCVSLHFAPSLCSDYLRFAFNVNCCVFESLDSRRRNWAVWWPLESHMSNKKMLYEEGARTQSNMRSKRQKKKKEREKET